MRSFRRRLEKSPAAARFVAVFAALYLRLCQWTIKWTVEGQDALEADLKNGPVLLVMWHERSLMGPVHWPVHAGPLSSLTATSVVGRISGALQKHFGLMPMAMSGSKSNVAASRTILSRVRDGISIGMTGDGPLGPALHVKDAPLDWARVMQRPVYVYAFATHSAKRLNTWDRMMVPKPFEKGAIVFAHCPLDLPRKADSLAIETARGQLHTTLNSAADRAVQLAK